MESITSFFTGKMQEPETKVEFWNNPEPSGWLMKQALKIQGSYSSEQLFDGQGFRRCVKQRVCV
jgi:hypothetical protein